MLLTKIITLLFWLCFYPFFIYGQEICDDGIDNDADGWVDLNDSDCACNGLLTAVNSLIPNPSFEDTLCCPNDVTQLNCAETWMQASLVGTSDYFNLCGFTNILGMRVPPVPLPGDGSGYAGFYNFVGYQEMVGACLYTAMNGGARYRFNLFLARGTSVVQPLVVTIYGTTDCSDLPWFGAACPLATGSWVWLGADTIEFQSASWQQATIEFDAPADISALAIGGSCTPQPGTVEQGNYYYIDELIVAELSAFNFNARVTETGKWCTNNLQLYADIDTVGGTWQWYRSGIALDGETTNVLNLNDYYRSDEVYTAVYSLGGKCVSVDHSVAVPFFGDNIPELIISPACNGVSNGGAYFADTLPDSLGFFYQWRSIEDDTILSVSDTLKNVPYGTYMLKITGNGGCDTIVSFEIPDMELNVSFSPSDTLVCTMDMLQLVNTSDSGFTTYCWTFGNGDTAFVADPSPFRYQTGGVYQITLSGAGDICIDTAFGTVKVDQPVSPAFRLDPEVVCVGQPVDIYPNVDSTTTQVVWTLAGDHLIESGIGARYQHAFDTPGILAIQATYHPRACPDTSYTDSITVYHLPEVDLGPDSSICLHGQAIYLKNLREAPSIPYHQLWSTGDTTEVLKVVHPGIYTLSVRTEPLGCTTTESVEISKDCYIDMPNAFTPDGDGHNDYFFPRQLLSESLTRFRMQVFNRWGQIVFETTNLNGRGWDGRFNGKAQPTGVYLYRIEADFANGRQEQYEGNVTLLR